MISIDKAKLKAVLFDLGGTLIYILNDPDFRTRTIYDQFKALLKPDDPLKPYDDHSQFMLNHWLDMKKDSFSMGEDFPLRDFIVSALNAYGFDKESIEGIVPNYEEIIFNYEYANTALYAGAIELLAYLKSNGFQVGLISNTSYDESRIRKMLRKVNIEKYFDFVITSSDECCSKPNPKIFYRALNMMGLKPDEALYIGDRPEFDAEGAKNAGMQWVIVDDETTLESVLNFLKSR